MTQRAPVMFIGHGSPMFALSPGKAGELLKEFSSHFKTTRAVLIISPHWMSKRLEITTSDRLETIHDFYGFPEALYQLSYNAPGSQTIAKEIAEHLQLDSFSVEGNKDRGRDHGAWVPMTHLLAEMQLPVLQLSLDRTLNNEELVSLGESLKGLRDKGIAVIASGSLTHNLYEIQQQNAPVVNYAARFQSWVRECVKERNVEQLSNPQSFSQDFQRAHPTDEHYLPLLIAMGASSPDDKLEVLEGGILHGVLSMESYGWV